MMRQRAGRLWYMTLLFQLTTIVASIASMIAWWSIGNRSREMRLYSLAPISWCMHLLAFYASLFINGDYGLPVFAVWRAGLITHGAIMLAAGAYVMIMHHRIAQAT